MKISLLRYPGGKGKLYPLIKNYAKDYSLTSRVYVEPFAGGFGIGMSAMSEGLFKGYIINDFDYHIYAFWCCVFKDTSSFVEIIKKANINMSEWKKQKKIYNDPKKYTLLEVGFATFFLNRTNFSGIIKGGPLGGVKQNSKYKINCRFNKEKLIERIEYIAKFESQVEIYNLDASDFIDQIIIPRCNELFVNFDPPYVERGAELYTNFYKTEDHILLREKIATLPHNLPWIMTYDDCKLTQILYGDYNLEKLSLKYFAGKFKDGKELLIKHL